MPDTHQIPRPAATVILARDTTDGIEVFLMKRTTAVSFAKGAHVFPGGGVDAEDHTAEIHARCSGLDDRLASAHLGIESGGLAYWVAAVRECFEEAGLLLGYHPDYDVLNPDEALALRLIRHRSALAENTLSFTELLKNESLNIAADQLIYYSHWVTGAGRPRRYDTRFFVAEAPAGQIAMHDNSETVAHLWVRPGQALEMSKTGELNLMFPTIKTLESLTRFSRVKDMLTFARSKPIVPLTAPRASVARDGSIRHLISGDHAFAEVVKLDPDSQGLTKSDIEPGHPVKLAKDLLRLTAPNPGVMTGPGTNSYLLGNAQTGIAVIDPGPDLGEHTEAILKFAAGDIKWILCTHTHKDHSPGAKKLKQATGAMTIGMPAPPHLNQDQDFKPDYVPEHHEVLTIAGCKLRVLHTPGHASNHICLMHENEKILFTGDHVMQGSTVVINPPDGNMATYLESLRMIMREDMTFFAPGHGFLIGQPKEAIERLLLHRLDRENKIVAALKQINTPQTLEQLVSIAYADTPVQRHQLASRSMLAHLQKLQCEGRAFETAQGWHSNPG